MSNVLDFLKVTPTEEPKASKPGFPSRKRAEPDELIDLLDRSFREDFAPPRHDLGIKVLARILAAMVIVIFVGLAFA